MPQEPNDEGQNHTSFGHHFAPDDFAAAPCSMPQEQIMKGKIIGYSAIILPLMILQRLRVGRRWCSSTSRPTARW
jgi:hypothetical protein